MSTLLRLYNSKHTEFCLHSLPCWLWPRTTREYYMHEGRGEKVMLLLISPRHNFFGFYFYFANICHFSTISLPSYYFLWILSRLWNEMQIIPPSCCVRRRRMLLNFVGLLWTLAKALRVIGQAVMTSHSRFAKDSALRDTKFCLLREHRVLADVLLKNFVAAYNYQRLILRLSHLMTQLISSYVFCMILAKFIELK